MKLLCSRCLTPQTILKEVGSLRRLECSHLVTFKPELVFNDAPINIDLSVQQMLENEFKYSLSNKRELVPVNNKVNHFFKNSKTGHTPYPFQVKGIDLIKTSNFKCLIADEMGLGKTVQALGGLKANEKDLLPVLIIVKSSLKIQWMVQVLNWCGYLSQVIENSSTPPIEDLFDVHIISYDLIRRFTERTKVKKMSKYGSEIEVEEESNILRSFPYKTIILDEVQSIKGESQRTNEVKEICKDKNVIALSGTPIKNHAAEYYTILNILRPDLFPTKEGYLRKYVRVETVAGIEKYGGLKRPEEFAELTKDFIIRRTRAEVKDEIGLRVTGANRHFFNVDFDSPKIKKQYEAEESAFIREMEAEGKKKNPLDLIARLSVLRHLVGVMKIQSTVEFLKEFLEETDRKILVGVHHKNVMEGMYLLTAKYCKDNNYKAPLRFDASLSTQERYAIVKRFQDGESRILFGSILAMGEGVDGLQYDCCDGILAERQWNPANEEQFEARLVRIGQPSPFVDFNYMIAVDTIDEYFTEIVEAKRKFMSETLDGKTYNWEESDLMAALYDAIVAKRGKKKTKRGF